MSSPLEEKDAIRDLVTRYCLYIDSGRDEEWVQLFTEDGAFDSPILGRWEGRAKLRDFTKRYADFTGSAQPRHCVTNVLVELDGPESARVECYLVMLHAGDGKTELVVSGRYEDRLAKQGDTWRFAEVRVHPDTELARASST